MTYENYLLWAEDTIKNPMTKSEFYKDQKEQLINKAEYNKELLKSLYNNKPLPEYITHITFYNYDNSYKLMYGAELETGKKYHILLKVLENGHVDGIDVYPNWYFNVNNYNTLYNYHEGITEYKHTFNTYKPYTFGLKDDDLYLIKKVN